MTQVTLPSITAQTAAEVCIHFDLTDEAKPLLKDDLTPQQFVELLVEHKLHVDAIKFLTHSLPKRETVWWACLCVGSVEAAHKEPADQALLEAAKAWVIRSSEENRRAAMTLTDASGYETAAAWTATAAVWSGGSLAPPDQPVVPPGEHLAAHAAGGAIQLAAAMTEPDKIQERQAAFVNFGLEVASGANRWPERPT